MLCYIFSAFKHTAAYTSPKGLRTCVRGVFIGFRVRTVVAYVSAYRL